MKVQLKEFKTKQWISKDGLSVIGSAFHQHKFLEGKLLFSLFESINNGDQLIDLLGKLDGSFAVIYNRQNFQAFAVDTWASIPLVYRRREEIDIIGNEFHAPWERNENAVGHFITLASSPINDTLFKDWFTLKAGEMMFLNAQGRWISRRYFAHHATNQRAFSIEKCKQALKSSTDNLIEYLGGRRAVIPLSGGLDSQLILAELVKANYTNIFCFTYGEKMDKEVSKAASICAALNIPWSFVPYDLEVLQSVLSEDWNTYDDESHFGCSLPYDQDFFAIKYLLEHQLIDTNRDVILPGYLGDHLGGSFHVFENSAPDQSAVLQAICDKFMIAEIPKDVSESIASFFLNSDDADVLSCYQDWLSVHRHARFICTGWRAYDYFGFDSYVFAANKEWTNFWYQLAWTERFKQNCYNSFVQGYLTNSLDLDFRGELLSGSSSIKSGIKNILPKSVVKFIKKNRVSHANYERKLLDILGNASVTSNVPSSDPFNVVHSRILLKKIFR